MKYVWLIATVLWFILMTCLSHQPGEATAATSLHLAELLGNTGFFEVGELNGILRKAAHVVTFLVLSLLVSMTLKAWDVDKRYVLLVFLWCLVDEATKPLIPGRHFAWFDVFLNLVGCLIGIVVGWIVC